MAIDGIFYLEQVVGGVKTPITTGTYYLRATPFSSNTYGPQTPDANGKLNFGTIADNEYELWTDSAKVNNFGVKWLGDKSPTFVTVTASTSVVTDTISEKTSNAGVTIDGVLLHDNLDSSGIVAKTGTQTGIAGAKTFTGMQTYSAGTTHNINSSGTGSTYYPVLAYSDGYVAPQSDYELSPKKYVDDQIAEVEATPYTESLTRVRVIQEVTAETGKIYNSVSAAALYFGSPAETKQCLIDIVSTGTGSQYMTVSHSSLISYVHLRGDKRVNLILGVSGASTTKTMTLSGMTIWMGANSGDITTDRTYTNFTFENCDIYAYKNLTFTNCKLKNVRIFQSSGFGVTLTGTTQIDNSIIMQTLDASGVTGNGYVANTTSEVHTTYTMPTDPSGTGS